MSYKIIDAIKKSNLPGRLKRVLEAYVSFGNKDGTNIRPSKERVAERAGVSRWTVNRNTDELVEMGLLVHDTDEKGNKQAYFYGYGHYAFVYHVDVATLQNATLQSKKQSSKMHRGQRSILHHRNVAKRAATIPVDQTLVDPSVTSVTGKVSKSVSDDRAVAPLHKPSASALSLDEGMGDESVVDGGSAPEPPLGVVLTPQTPIGRIKAPPNNGNQAERRLMCTEKELDRIIDLCLMMGWGERARNSKDDPGYMDFMEDALFCLRVFNEKELEYTLFAIWQHEHPYKTLRPFHTVKQLRAALESKAENNVIKQFESHYRDACPTCMRRIWEMHRAKVETMCVCDVCKRWAAKQG